MNKVTLTLGDLQLGAQLIVLFLFFHQSRLESLVLRYYSPGLGLHKLQWVDSASGCARKLNHPFCEQVSSRPDSRRID